MAEARTFVAGGGVIENAFSYSTANGGTLTVGTPAYPVERFTFRSATAIIQMGTAPGIISAINVDTSSYGGNGIDFLGANSYIGTSSAHSLLFYTNNTTRWGIDSTGSTFPSTANGLDWGTSGNPWRAIFANSETLVQSAANTAQVVMSGGSLTGSNATTFWSYAATWNTSGTPTAIKVAITNTASNAASLLMNLLAGAGGATSMFSVDVNGFVAANRFTVASSGVMNFSARSVMTSPADGQWNVSNNGNTAGVGFDFATDAILKLRVRAQNAYATLDVLGLRASGAAGASFGPAAPASITVVNGIVTAIS